MLRIPDRPLSTPVAAKLQEYQAAISGLPAFAQRVEEAKKEFSKYNKKTNATFKEIRKALDEMCSGARRCMYCEDSVADEVEHFKPKDFYPELVFTWSNYLYACGPCNGGKNNKFPVISALTGQIVHLPRVSKEPVEPEAGEAALLDLRTENPLEFLQLDLQDTFYFQPLDPDRRSIRYQRARQVIDILCLNSRDYLCRARAEAFGSYRARLKEYVAGKETGEAQESLDLLRMALHHMGHPTVWAEMKRQRDRFPQLRDLFARAPEALEW